MKAENKDILKEPSTSYEGKYSYADYLTWQIDGGKPQATGMKVALPVGFHLVTVTAQDDRQPFRSATPRNFVLRTDLIVHELLTHRVFVYLRRDWKLRTASFEPFVLGRITYRTRDVAIDLFEGSK
mgnify:CR=1 FL=1